MDRVAREAAVAAVLAAEREWTDAFRRGDVTAIDAMMAAEYVQITDDGRAVGREEVIRSLREDGRAWEYAESDEHDVRVYGDAAVVIGRWTARGVNNGVRFDYRARFLSVYVRRDGRWLVATDQSTPISG
jgi:ketosteroid isomerase-like protein